MARRRGGGAGEERGCSRTRMRRVGQAGRATTGTTRRRSASSSSSASILRSSRCVRRSLPAFCLSLSTGEDAHEAVLLAARSARSRRCARRGSAMPEPQRGGRRARSASSRPPAPLWSRRADEYPQQHMPLSTRIGMRLLFHGLDHGRLASSRRTEQVRPSSSSSRLSRARTHSTDPSTAHRRLSSGQSAKVSSPRLHAALAPPDPAQPSQGASSTTRSTPTSASRPSSAPTAVRPARSLFSSTRSRTDDRPQVDCTQLREPDLRNYPTMNSFFTRCARLSLSLPLCRESC